jgi:hypothetical protein
MIVNKDLEKEIALAEDLQEKLKDIENPSILKRKRKKVSQDVASPRDAEVDKSIGEMGDMKQKLDNIASVKESIAYPDAKKHQHISFVKSFFRILAGVVLCFGEFTIAGLLLIVAELLGIYEEMV